MSNDHGSRLRDLIDALGKLPRHFQHWQNPDGWIKPQELSALLRASASALSPEPAPPAEWFKVIHAIAVEAMTAQSDPNAEAMMYRKALIGICNMALKARAALSPSSSPSQQQGTLALPDDVFASIETACRDIGIVTTAVRTRLRLLAEEAYTAGFKESARQGSSSSPSSKREREKKNETTI